MGTSGSFADSTTSGLRVGAVFAYGGDSSDSSSGSSRRSNAVFAYGNVAPAESSISTASTPRLSALHFARMPSPRSLLSQVEVGPAAGPVSSAHGGRLTSGLGSNSSSASSGSGSSSSGGGVSSGSGNSSSCSADPFATEYLLHEQPTNSIGYCSLYFDLSPLPRSFLPLVPLLSWALSSLGTHATDEVSMSHRIGRYTGCVGASISGA